MGVEEPEHEVVVKTRSKRKKPRATRQSTHFGDIDFEADDLVGEASWLEVCQNCFIHSPHEWFIILIGMILILGCLYFFGLGLDFMGSGAKVMTGCAAGELFADSINPVAGVMIGILATVLLQSSSSTTSIVVGLVGADHSLINVQQGIYLIMGANIGTTVTNTIVSLGHFQKSEQLELAFAGATIHDLFNYLTVAILLPLEVATGYLYRLTGALIGGADTEKGDAWEGPAKKLISPLSHKVLIANKAVANAVASGGSCDEFYPIICADPENPTKSTCKVGLIACDKKTGQCPAFFDPYAGPGEDQTAGVVVFCIGLFVVFFSLLGLVQVLTSLLKGVSVRIIYKATNINGYLLIALGAAITTMLQSSSTTTAFMTPLVGIGALRLDQMYPLTIGANLGTTISALLSALVTDGNEALQVALAHMMFNLTGMMIWYPIPFMRNIPICFAKRLGQYAKVWPSFTLFYLFGMFFLMPGVFLGLAALFLAGTSKLTITASVLTALLGLLVIFWIRWCYFQGGRVQFYRYLEITRAQYDAKLTLPTDMDRAKRQIRQHQEYAGLRALTDYAQDRKPDEIPEEHKTGQRASVQRSLRKLSKDMNFVKTAISMLYFHTGLPEDNDGVDIEDGEGGRSSEEEEDHTSEEERNAEQPKQKRQMAQEEEGSFLQQVPLSFKIAVVILMPLLVWALVKLYTHGGTSATGAAAFLTVLLGLGLLYCLHLWFSEAGRKAIIEYFRNHRLRHVYIQRLPNDMMQSKTELKELLSHYRLKIEDVMMEGQSSSADSTTE
jgi:sodium-dependent phosphate cotransporter